MPRRRRVALIVATSIVAAGCTQNEKSPSGPPPEPPIAVPGGAIEPRDADVGDLGGPPGDAPAGERGAEPVVREGSASPKTVGAGSAAAKVVGAGSAAVKVVGRGSASSKVGDVPDAGVVTAALDAAVPACACTPPSASTKERSREPSNHLTPEQGTLRVSGTEVTLTAATGWHIATDYSIKLYLEPSEGVSLARAPLTAGGRAKASGDATVLSEQTLTFRVAAGGAGEIAGILSFGICEADSCHPRLQPITIRVAAKN